MRAERLLLLLALALAGCAPNLPAPDVTVKASAYLPGQGGQLSLIHISEPTRPY